MRKAIYALVGVLSATGIYANAKADIKTTYNITQSSAESRTVIKNDASKEALLKDYLLGALKKSFLGSDLITGIQETKGTETKEEYQGLDYTTYNKKSNIFVNVSLPEKVSMMFAVDQKYQGCKKQSAESCYLSSSITITGPMAVYGNYASPIDVNALMKNKQELYVDMSRSYDGDLNLNSRFTINSNNFEERLAKFMEVFNIPIPTGADIGVGGTKLSGNLLTRQRMLVGIARFLRQSNERIAQ